MTQGGCPSLAAQFQTDFCQSFFNGAGGMKLCVQNMAPVPGPGTWSGGVIPAGTCGGVVAPKEGIGNFHNSTELSRS